MGSATKTRLVVAILCLPALSLAGCQLLSWSVAAFVPTPKTSAAYEIDKSFRMLVFPDSPHCDLEFPTIRDWLARKLNARLVEQDLVAATVPFDSLRVHQEQMDRQYRLAEGQPAPLSALAEKLGADAVLYIDIRQFRLRSAPGEPVWAGRLSVMVRMVDAGGKRLWPPADRAHGYPIVVEMTPTTDDSTTYGLTLTEKMADRMAERIVQLFCEHRPAS